MASVLAIVKNAAMNMGVYSYYGKIERGEVLAQATTRMSLEKILPRERSQKQRATRWVIAFTGNVQTRQMRRDRKIGGCCGEWVGWRSGDDY